MDFAIDINAAQFLAVTAQAVLTGVVIGIAIGIKLYMRFGRAA